MKRFAVAYMVNCAGELRIEFVNADSGFDALKIIFDTSYEPDMTEEEFLNMLWDSEIDVNYKEITQ